MKRKILSALLAMGLILGMMPPKICAATETITQNACSHANKTETAARAATCTASGNSKYYYCNDCAQYLKEDGITPTTVAAETIPALGHNWGAPTYTWSPDNSTCRATRSCQREGCAETETETVTADVTTTATCTEAGTNTYTATFANAAFEVQTKNVAVDALGHDFQDVVMQVATAEKLGIKATKCTRCGDVRDQYEYALENTSPTKHADGTYLSEDSVASFTTGTFTIDGKAKNIRVTLQDPQGIYAGHAVELDINDMSVNLGEDYDGNISVENAYVTDCVLKVDGVETRGQLPGGMRLLLEIPDDWDADELQVQRINIGADTAYVEAIEYHVYDSDDNFIRIVDKDYVPRAGETVKKFAAVWTDHFSKYAVIIQKKAQNTPASTTAQPATTATEASSASTSDDSGVKAQSAETTTATKTSKAPKTGDSYAGLYVAFILLLASNAAAWYLLFAKKQK